MARTHLSTSSKHVADNSWTFISGLDGTEQTDQDSSTASTQHQTAELRVSQGDSGEQSDAAIRHAHSTVERDPVYKDPWCTSDSVQTLPNDHAWKGDRCRPRRASSSVGTAEANAAVSRLLGVASHRRASNTGHVAGMASSRLAS